MDRAVRTLPKRSLREKILITLGIITTLATILGACGSAFALRQSRKLQRDNLDLASASGGQANWLLVGTDSREGIDPNDPNASAFVGGAGYVKGKRTDTMIIVRVDPAYQTMDIMSVPRDLWVNIDGNYGRVNSSYKSNDPNLSEQENETQARKNLISTIQNNLDIKINHYAEIDFVGFKTMVDSIGGVEIEFEKPARDTHSGLNVGAGLQKLDGDQALAYVRSRYYEEQQPNGQWKRDPTSDLGRTSRQRKFIVQVANNYVADAVSFDIANLDQQISVAAENMVFSNSVSYGSLLDLAKTFRSAGSENIHSHSLPVVADRVGNAEVLRLDTRTADSVLDIFRGKKALGGIVVDVLNGSGVKGQATKASEVLESRGIEIGEVGNYEPVKERSVIIYNPTYKKAAEELASYYQIEMELVEDPNIKQITVITGKNYP